MLDALGNQSLADTSMVERLLPMPLKLNFVMPAENKLFHRSSSQQSTDQCHLSLMFP